MALLTVKNYGYFYSQIQLRSSLSYLCVFLCIAPKSNQNFATNKETRANRFFASQFSSLLTNVVGYLDKSCSDKLEACKHFCSTLHISDNSDQLLFDDEQLKTINNCSSFQELFFASQLRHHWDWAEYSILEHIIDLSKSKEAEDEFQRFGEFMASKRGMEIISDTVSIQNLPPKVKRLSVILNRPYAKLTAEQYLEIKNFIFATLDVEKYISYPYISFLFSSLRLEWYIPVLAADHIIKMARLHENELLSQFVTFVSIGDDIVLNTQVGYLYNIYKHKEKFVILQAIGII